MSDLPSREVVQEWVAKGSQGANPILAAYADGRLVDREAIDYEQADGLLYQFVETVLDEFDGSMPRNEALWNRTLDIIKAALGEGET